MLPNAVNPYVVPETVLIIVMLRVVPPTVFEPSIVKIPTPAAICHTMPAIPIRSTTTVAPTSGLKIIGAVAVLVKVVTERVFALL